jgi:hypothetical protein
MMFNQELKMTLEHAIVAARLQAVAEYGYRGTPDLNNQRSADAHDAKMHELFDLMEQAENKVRASWKEPTKKIKETA